MDNGSPDELCYHCFCCLFRPGSDGLACALVSRRTIYGSAAGCLRRRCSAAVQLIHGESSAAQRLHEPERKQGQCRLQSGDGGWQKKEKNWLITVPKEEPLGVYSVITGHGLAMS